MGVAELSVVVGAARAVRVTTGGPLASFHAWDGLYCAPSRKEVLVSTSRWAADLAPHPDENATYHIGITVTHAST